MTTEQGRVIRAMREGDEVRLISEDGAEIGSVRLIQSPNNTRVRVAFRFNRDIRIDARAREATDA